MKENKADISKAKTKAIQKVMRNIKEIGQDELEESVQAIEKAEELKKNIKSSKVRNQSIERATQVGKTVGYLAEEENPEQFADKFEVKTNKAEEKNTKANNRDSTINIDRRGGQFIEEEVVDDISLPKAKRESASMQETKSRAKEKVIRNVNLLESGQKEEKSK